MTLIAWEARIGGTVYQWPATSGPLFDAVQAADPEDPAEWIWWPEGHTLLDKRSPEAVYHWWSQQRGGHDDEILVWDTDGHTGWDGRTVR